MRYSATPMGVSTHNVYAPLPTSKGYTGDNPSRGDGRVTASQTLDSCPHLLKGLMYASKLTLSLLSSTEARCYIPWVVGVPEAWSRGYSRGSEGGVLPVQRHLRCELWQRAKLRRDRASQFVLVQGQDLEFLERGELGRDHAIQLVRRQSELLELS